MILKIKVNTASKILKIIKLAEDSFEIKFKAVRENGEANIKLIDILSKHFNIPKTSISITSGKTTSNKIIEILEN